MMEVDENNSGTITDEEKALILKLRENIKVELPFSITSLSIEDQDLFFVRWIRARDLNLAKSEKMLNFSLKWRIERNADQALDFKINPFFNENFSFGVSDEADKFGHPVVLLPMADWDMRKVVNDPDRLAEFDDFATYFFEVMCSHVKREHDKRKETGKGPVTQVTMLIDVKNFSYAQLMNLRAISKLLQMAAMYEAHYPEILYRVFFISCPQYFGLFITMLKPILAPRTLSKIICYSQMAEWQKVMEELVDPIHIPERYGGSKII